MSNYKVAHIKIYAHQSFFFKEAHPSSSEKMKPPYVKVPPKHEYILPQYP
jgi:hypothetical protein